MFRKVPSIAACCLTVYVIGLCTEGGSTEVLMPSKLRFWQISDIHLDWLYSMSGSIQDNCHNTKSETGASGTLSPLGDYACDAPMELVQSALRHMKKEEPNPAFILWSGDSLPHWLYGTITKDDVLEAIHNLTNEVRSVFPDVLLIPTIGNHDVVPAHQMDEQRHWLYEGLLKFWEEYIPLDQWNNFLLGGYFRVDVYGFRVLVLDTVLYYDENKATLNETDPARQFEWLKNELDAAARDNIQVIITGHVPVGPSERTGEGNFHDVFNERFLDITEQYSDTISLHLYAHEHTDSFRAWKDGEERYGVAFLSPSITPWRNHWYPAAVPNNPSVRLYDMEVSPENVLVNDYYQYFLNLSRQEHCETFSCLDTWELEYRFCEIYGVPDASKLSLHRVANSLSDESIGSFERYYTFNKVSYPQDRCEGQCRDIHICAIQHVRMQEFTDCLGQKYFSS